MKNKIKILLFLLICFFGSMGFAQSFELEDVTPGCLDHNGQKIFRIIDKTDEITGMSVISYGGITATLLDSLITVTASNPNSYGTGYFRVFGNYQFDTNNPCVASGCFSATGTIMRESPTIVQSFSHSEIIKGPDYISRGKEYAFTIKPFIGSDYFRWTYPDYLTLLYCTSDSSSLTFFVEQNAQFSPNDTISVIAGQCPSNTSVGKKLRPGTEMPNVTHDSLTCTDNIRFSFTIENPKEEYKYWWKTSVPAWNMQMKNGEITDIWVITDSVAQSGVVTLYVSNGIDTVSREFAIVKKMTKSIKLVGDTACIARGEGLEYFMYPSPDVEVNWYLPAGWAGDELNPHSSSVYLGVGDNATSGYIVVYTAVCDEMLDSVAVTVKSLYSEEKGIYVKDDVTCFVIGEETEFYIESDPTVESYEWIFPEEWGIENHVTTYPFDTVVSVAIGNAKGSITVAGKTCDTIWERSYEINLFAPVLPNDIVLDGRSCVNSRWTDTITLVAVGAKEVTSYIWDYPAMWTVLETADSTIRLITNKDAAGSYDVSVKVENQECGRAEESVSKTIVQSGIGENIYFQYTPGTIGRVKINVYPSSGDSYVYKWYIEPDFITVISINSSCSVTRADTATKNHCVIISDTTSGCSSMECTKPIIADIDTVSRDSVTVEVSQSEPELLSSSFGNKNDNTSEEISMDFVEYSASGLTEDSDDKDIAEKSESELSFENTDNFIVYPNPARNHINILLEKSADYIEILNINGRIVQRKKCTSQNTELNVDNLQSGLYIIKVTSNGVVKTKKLQIIK
ncbi:MAG: T9SS type A sorting domain-containing protein [Bacteroidales bacterium]|jgi:hypothetical protein|nr:T9SS type A sorting domain-containing protein [Bacteroidales bacterium]